MITWLLAHIVGFLGGGIAGGVAGWILIVLVLPLLFTIFRSDQVSPSRVIIPMVFLMSGLCGLIIIYIGSLIIGLFKITPSWILVPVYILAFWLDLKNRWPEPGKRLAIFAGVVCGLFAGSLFFLSY